MAIATTAPRLRLHPSPRLLGDERLARLAAQGDREALAAIFERHHQALYRYCRALLGNGEDAQDALQNAMARMVRALPGERREVALKAWLYRLAHNEAMRIVERRRPQTDLEQAGELPAPDGEDGLVARERLAVLLADLRELSERQRGALILRELEGASFAQVAEVFGGSEAAARQTVHEARLCLGDFERGRAMTCDEVTRALSDGDRRRLRGRGVRAHLRACDGCRAFEEALRHRPRELAALAPPLGAPLAAGLLGKLVGGGTGAGGGLGGTAAGAGTVAGAAALPAMALKGLAVLSVTAGVAAGVPQVVGALGEAGGPPAGVMRGEGAQPPQTAARSGGARLAGGPDEAMGQPGSVFPGEQPRGAGADRTREPEGRGREGSGASAQTMPAGGVRRDTPRGEAPSGTPRPDMPASGRPPREVPRQPPAADRPQAVAPARPVPDGGRPSRPPLPEPVSGPAPSVMPPAPGAPTLPAPAPPVPDVPDAPSGAGRR